MEKNMKDELVGVYLHGSIILNAFNPKSGDIDILAVDKDSWQNFFIQNNEENFIKV